MLHAGAEIASSGQIDRATTRHGGEPRARVSRNAVGPPRGERPRVRILDALFGDVDVASDAQRRREDESPLSSVGFRDRRGDLRRIRVTNVVNS